MQTFLEMTRACNFRCEHCFSSSSTPRKNELTTKEWFNVFDQLFDLGVLRVNMTGGEPMLRKDMLEILDYTRQYGDAQRHIFFTNGSLWTKDFFDSFIHIWRKQPFEVQISMDGYSYSTYSHAREGSPEDFNQILRTIEWLKAEDVFVFVCITITKRTIDNALKIAHWALHDLGVDAVHVIPLFLSGRAIPNYESLSFTFDEWSNLVRETTLIKRDQLWGGLEQRLNMGFFTWYEIVLALKQQGLFEEIESVWHLNKEEFLSSRRDVYCEAGVTELYIESDGKVYPCVPSVDTEFYLGNVKDTSLEYMWEHSPCLTWFRTKARDVRDKEPCASCEEGDVCCGGCRVAALILCNDKNAVDPRCPLVKNEPAV